MKKKTLLHNVLTPALALSLTMTSSITPLLAETPHAAEEQNDKVNIALNKPTISSKVEGSQEGGYAVDGNDSTYWASPNPSELTVDLEGIYLIDEINLLAYFYSWEGVDRYYEYEIYAGTDLDHLEKVAEKQGTDFEVPEGTSYLFEGEKQFSARYIQVRIKKTHAEGQPNNNTGHIRELRVYGTLDPNAEQPVKHENVARGKTAFASSHESNNSADKAIDGNKGSYWAASNPTCIDVDLEAWYDIDEIKVIPYYSDQRFYHYEVLVSDDGYDYEKIGEKKDDAWQTADGETYTFEKRTARYVRVNMLSNSKNPAVHVNEIEVYGALNPDYKPSADEDFEGDIALNKPVRSYSSQNGREPSNINDGQKATGWTALYYPGYVDIDLEDNYALNKLVVMPSNANPNAYYQYSVYTSMDGVSFDLLCEKQDRNPVNSKGDIYHLDGQNACIVRIYLEYASDAPTGSIQEVAVFGDKLDTEVQQRPVIQVKDFADSEYAAPITQEETLEEVRGVVSRTIGAQYNDWFDFVLDEQTETENDWYELSTVNGKIQIRGNKGLSLTTGLNYYLKYYCNVSITQQARNVTMPDAVVPIEGTIRKETPYAIRYAYNYCTHSYTMAFWGEEEWQNELDWLALNGFNAILDITGQEEVWHRFLNELGYSDDEVKDWLVGPGYYGWQYMANMENVNGPVPDNWFETRTTLARSNQRKMRALGMTPIMQSYSGMVPNSINEKDPNAQIIPQGLWNGMQRPAMLKTNTDTYTDYAAKFYKAQKDVFGDISYLYATDPFHEGGNTGGIGREIVGRRVLDEMLKADEDAMWVIQSWSFQPELLSQITAEEKLDHILLLDLNATKGARYSSTGEFAGSNWVYCMLENYGGRSGLNGNLEKYTHIPSQVKNQTSHMVGMGISPEGTNNNPVRFDLYLEMMWESEDIDLQEWIEHYIERRYGTVTENTRKAWDLILQSCYQNNSGYADPPESIFNGRPQFNLSKSAPNGNMSISYDKVRLEKALSYLMKDYDLLKDSEGYLYDVTDFLRQATANSGMQTNQAFTSAFNDGDKETFQEQSAKFLEMVAFQDDVLSSNSSFMVGTWLEPAMKAGEGQDEFTKKIFELNSKALITTWAPYYCWGVYDYANREYAGLTRDYYLVRWEDWIDRLSRKLDGEDVPNYSEVTTDESHELAWEWARSDKEYGTKATTNVKALYETFDKKYSLMNQGSDPKLIRYTDMTVTSEIPVMGSYSLDRAFDGNPDTFWSSEYGTYEPWEILFEFDDMETINKFSILPRNYSSRQTGNGDILGIELYTSADGETWQKAAEGSYERNGEERVCTFDPVTTKHLKLVITDFLIWNNNQSIKSVTAGEFRVYRAYPMADSSTLDLSGSTIDGVASDTTVSGLLSQFNVPEKGIVRVLRDGEELDGEVLIQSGDVVEYSYNGTAARTWTIGELKVPADFTALNQLISSCEAFKQEDYTAESWNAFAQALTLAVGVQVNPEATQEEIDAACTSLQTALDALVLAESTENWKMLLSMSLEYARTWKENNPDSTVHPLVLQRLDEAMEQASQILEDPKASKEEILDAWRALTNAIQMLDFTSDKTELLALIAQMEQVDLSLYEDDEARAAFVAALEAAKAVADSDTALDETSIQPAIQALRDAFTALNPAVPDVDVTLLQLLVETASQIDRSAYMSDGLAEFEAALTHAQAILDHPESQSVVDEALTTLHQTWLSLRLKADEDLLSKLTETRAALMTFRTSSFCTQDQAVRAMNLMTRMDAVLEAPEASKADVESLIAEANELMGLPETPEDNQKPQETPKPEDKTEPAKPAQSESDTSTTQKSQSVRKSVSTAASSRLGAAAAAILGSAGLLHLLSRKRRKH